VAAERSRSGDRESLSLYLDDVRQHRLLTAADEQRLGAAILAGKLAAEELGSAASVPPRRRRELMAMVREADRARHEFITANLRLVVSVARRFEGTGLSLGDLIQEGNIGLMRAVERFDHRKGFKFSTYATWWIRQAIGRALADSSRTIRVPSHMREMYALVDHSRERLTRLLGRQPTADELATEAGITTEQVNLIQQHRQHLLSLSDPLGGDQSLELGDTIPDDTAVDAFDSAMASFDRADIDARLDLLKPRERDVVRARFGLGERPRTLGEIGEEHGVTRERIRQIEARALGKLRHPCTLPVRGRRRSNNVT
jgi:RNA polymerase primary sigma factor